MREKKILWTLFRSFFKIGLFTFGGGYAMLPLIESVCVEKRGWITREQMLQITVIAESTPGPGAINCATYVGNLRAGFPGALCATFGVVLPSFAVILAVSAFLGAFMEIPVVANAFRGIRIAVSLLILRAGLRMLRGLGKELLPRLILVCAFVLMLLINIFSWRFSTVWMLLIAGAACFAVALICDGRKRGGGDP